MPLIDWYKKNKEEILSKNLNQIISFAGSGGLKDGSQSSLEFREYLRIVQSDLLKKYCHQCLEEKFNESGLALQDLVNEVGRRIGYTCENGRYRGVKNEIGYDGIWTSKTDQKIIIEVKTTDAYRIDLNVIGDYKKRLIRENRVPENSSILIIVGREDTGDLEAQVRGSKLAWDIRLISIEALLRLMDIKEELEDPKTTNKIFDILVPREFTKLDEIIEILFSTTTDIKLREVDEAELDAEPEPGGKRKKIAKADFREECIEKIKSHLKTDLIKDSFATFSNEKESIGLVCAISKENDFGVRKTYWFAFHPHQKEYLEKFKKGYLAYGCGSPNLIVLIPFENIRSELKKLNITENETRMYWHIHITHNGSKYILATKKGFDKIDLAKYIIK